MRRIDPLASSSAFSPRGLNLERAADYIGATHEEFRRLVSRGQMPKPGTISGNEVWDRRKIDAAFERLMFVQDETPLDWSTQPAHLRPWLPPAPAEGDQDPIERVPDCRGFTILYYSRPGRAKVRLPSSIGSEKFRKAYVKAESEYRDYLALGHDTGIEKKSTLEWLCNQYFNSMEFKTGLNESTGHNRRRKLQNLCGFLNDAGERLGKTAYTEFTSHDLRVVRRELAGTPGGANAYLMAARGLFRFAVNAGLLRENIARDVEFYPRSKGGQHSWTLSEIHQFQATHVVGSQARLALDLALYTGQRRADLVDLGPPHECDGWLVFTQRKNRRHNPTQVEIPIAAELRRSIDAAHTGQDYYLLTRRGSAMSPNWLGAMFRRWCDSAGLPKRCSLHGLRKAMAARMASLGVTDRDIMAVTGHRSGLNVDRYTRGAHRRLRAERAMEHLNFDS